MIGKSSIVVAAWVALTSLASAQVKSVSTECNIFGAGLAAVPPPSGGGPGILPIDFSLGTATHFVRFPTISGTGQAGSATTWLVVGPDGGIDDVNGTLRPSDINSEGSISGIKCDRHLFLAGVFLGATPPSGAPPARLDFRSSATGIDFLCIRPGLQQVFFIGDGRTSSGTEQSFIVPAGATRLFLGIADAGAFIGDQGYYHDNTGTFVASVTVQPMPNLSIALSGSDATIAANNLADCLSYNLERSTDLSIWTPASTLSPSAGSATYTATGGAIGVRMFWRLRW